MIWAVKRWLLVPGFVVALVCFTFPFFTMTGPDGSAHATGLQLVLDDPAITAVDAAAVDPSVGVSITEAAHSWAGPARVLAGALIVGLVGALSRRPGLRVIAWVGWAVAAALAFLIAIDASLALRPDVSVRWGFEVLALVLLLVVPISIVLLLLAELIAGWFRQPPAGDLID